MLLWSQAVFIDSEKTLQYVDDFRAWSLTTLGPGGPKLVSHTPLLQIGLFYYLRIVYDRFL